MTLPASVAVELLFISLIVVAIVCPSSSIQWYRTAMGNSDRLSQQTTVSFGGDFTSSSTITVNR